MLSKNTRQKSGKNVLGLVIVGLLVALNVFSCTSSLRVHYVIEKKLMPLIDGCGECMNQL